jgi:hypothetical protein
MILNGGFFNQNGNTYNVAYSNVSATITIPVSHEVFDNLRITNTSGNTVFMNVSLTNPTTIAAPTAGANGSSNVFSVPTGQSTFINSGINQPGNVFISTISIAGSGSVFLETGSFI